MQFVVVEHDSEHGFKARTQTGGLFETTEQAERDGDRTAEREESRRRAQGRISYNARPHREAGTPSSGATP